MLKEVYFTIVAITGGQLTAAQQNVVSTSTSLPIFPFVSFFGYSSSDGLTILRREYHPISLWKIWRWAWHMGAQTKFYISVWRREDAREPSIIPMNIFIPELDFIENRKTVEEWNECPLWRGDILKCSTHAIVSGGFHVEHENNAENPMNWDSDDACASHHKT